MSGLPEIRPHLRPSPGSLAARLLESRETAERLLPVAAFEGPGAGGNPSRLPAEAFRSAGPSATERLRRVLSGDGVFVSTGQQPMLFLGPLYVLYKALSAIELARRVEADSGRPALALFWVGSDDHDWAEVGRTRVLDPANRLRELRLAPPSGWAGRPAGLAPLPEEARDLMDELFQYMPDTDFIEVYLDLFRDAWTPGRSIGEAFGASLAGVLGDRPVAWLDAGAPALKRAAAPLFERSLRGAVEEEAALTAGAKRIVEAGGEAPIPVLDGATNVFYDTGAARERLYRQGGELRQGRDGEARPFERVLEELEASPERFGPNVALRPVLERWLLPIGATVLGPGELAYWSQLPELFSRHGVEMPAVRPRHGWLLVEDKVRKVLDKLEAEPEELADGGDEVARRMVREARPPEVDRALAELRAAIGRGIGGVEEAVAAHLPGIRSAVGKARSQAFRTAGELEAQIDARLRERREVLLEQIHKASLHLFPDRRPQERVQSPLYYLARYGPALVDAVAERAAAVTPPLWPER